MKKTLAILALLGTASWAEDAFYRHHQRTTTTSLETDLVAREVGIDASARNSLVAKKQDGTLIHVVSKEMDTASLSGVLNVAGSSNLSGPVKMAYYTSGRVPYFSTGGLVANLSGFTFNGTALTAPNITATSELAAASVIASESVRADTIIASVALKFDAAGSAADWSLWRSSTAGLAIRGGAGSSYDFALFNPAAQYLIRNPTGTQGLEFPGSGTHAFTGPVTAASTLGIAGIATFGGASTGVIKAGTDLELHCNSTAHSIYFGDNNSKYDQIRFRGNNTVRMLDIAGDVAAFGGKVTGSDTVAALLGFRAGNTDASNVNLYRSGADMWTTPDSLTVAGKVVADTLISPKFYEEGSFTATGTGCSVAFSGTAKWVRFGKAVILMIPQLSCPSSDLTTFTFTGLPAAIQPATTQYSMAFPNGFVADGGISVNDVSASVGASGTVTFYRSWVSTGWTASSVKGISGNITFPYTLQ